jgi:hypothetical protein
VATSVRTGSARQHSCRARLRGPLLGSAVLYATRLAADERLATRAGGKATLASGPIEVRGEWPGSLPHAVLAVVSRMREACLTGVRLVSDRQPRRLVVDDHASGPPYVWLHFDGLTLASIVVDIGPRDWCKLTYPFGHELGPVLCNSWGRTRSRRCRANGWRRRWWSRSRFAAWGFLPTVGRRTCRFRRTRRLPTRSGCIGTTC